MWQQDCFLNSWISSNSCNLLLPAEISAGKWDFILNTHLSIPPLPCMCQYAHCQKKEENDAHVFTTACLFWAEMHFKDISCIRLVHSITCSLHVLFPFPQFPTRMHTNFSAARLETPNLNFMIKTQFKCNIYIIFLPLVWITCVIAFQENSPCSISNTARHSR